MSSSSGKRSARANARGGGKSAEEELVEAVAERAAAEAMLMAEKMSREEEAGGGRASHKKRPAVGQPTLSSFPHPAKRRAPVKVPWEDRLAQLRAYKAEYGDLLIPIRYQKDPSLGKFVHNMREQYKLFMGTAPEGYRKRCSLTGERVQQLEEIGFVWSTERKKRQSEDWEARFGQLKKYKEEHGDCLVPHGYEPDPSLAEWIHRQRTTYSSMIKDNKIMANSMIRERMQKLQEIGFNFTVHKDKWMEHWHELKAYKEKHGHCQVPTNYVENPQLGRWVHTQRHHRRLQLKGKKSSMTPQRINLLSQLDFPWEVRAGFDRPRASWQQRLDELKGYHEENNNFLMSPDGYPELHAWAVQQRTRLKMLFLKGKDSKENRMGPERVNALAELGFTKDTELATRAEDAETVTEVDDSDLPAEVVETGAEETASV